LISQLDSFTSVRHDVPNQGKDPDLKPDRRQAIEELLILAESRLTNGASEECYRALVEAILLLAPHAL
jgi:hypothetical protein